MGHNVIETVLGALVLAVAALFIGFAYSSADLQTVKGYIVSANFPMIDGLKEGSDVKMNGVKIGSIFSQDLITDEGPSQYMVNVKMTIDPRVKLPTDTIAMVASESLLGGKYMSLEVGVDEDYVSIDGTGKITHTQAPMRLDDLIGQMIYSKKSDASSKPADSAAKPAAPAVESKAAPKSEEPSVASKPTVEAPALPKPAAETPALPKPAVEAKPAPETKPVVVEQPGVLTPPAESLQTPPAQPATATP